MNIYDRFYVATKTRHFGEFVSGGMCLVEAVARVKDTAEKRVMFLIGKDQNVYFPESEFLSIEIHRLEYEQIVPENTKPA